MGGGGADGALAVAWNDGLLAGVSTDVASGTGSGAVGGAVGQLYQMFFEQSEASTYSSSFQAQQPNTLDDF